MDLVRAAVANHRERFRRRATRSERIGDLELLVSGRAATLPFPRSHRSLDEAVARIRRRRLREVGAWSAGEDAALGTRLVARGFQWGWQPHWMGIELAALPDEEPRHRVEAGGGPQAPELPYGGIAARGERELVVRERGAAIGRACLLPWRGVAGIYDVGVVRSRRRRGIGRALTLAACREARGLGCTHAVLNATADGELLYAALGFESAGLGRTWWWFPRRAPSARRVALIEAAGFGDLDTLARLRPRGAEPAELHVLALDTGRADTAAWLVDRHPSLAASEILAP